MMFPRCGVLLTYGRAEVMRIFLLPGSGRIGCVVEPMAREVTQQGGERESRGVENTMYLVGGEEARARSWRGSIEGSIEEGQLFAPLYGWRAWADTLTHKLRDHFSHCPKSDQLTRMLLNVYSTHKSNITVVNSNMMYLS